MGFSEFCQSSKKRMDGFVACSGLLCLPRLPGYLGSLEKCGEKNRSHYSHNYQSFPKHQ